MASWRESLPLGQQWQECRAKQVGSSCRQGGRKAARQVHWGECYAENSAIANGFWNIFPADAQREASPGRRSLAETMINPKAQK
jgi:hypothetical protein